jgi:hypothetical protein
MADPEDPTDEVGYKRPPRHTRFKPGQSGNLKGRPKGTKNFATVMDKELSTKIEVTENGRRRRISKREAIVKQTVNKAASGDPKATVVLLNEARFHESQNQSPVAHTPVLPRTKWLWTISCKEYGYRDPVVANPNWKGREKNATYYLSPRRKNSDAAIYIVGRGISIHPAS